MGQDLAESERPITDISYRVRDDDANQSTALIERRVTDRSYRVGCSIIGDGWWDDD